MGEHHSDEIVEVEGGVIFIGIPVHVEQDTCSKRTQTLHDGYGEVAMALLCFSAL
jgi:hypothetical protein